MKLKKYPLAMREVMVHSSREAAEALDQDFCGSRSSPDILYAAGQLLTASENNVQSTTLPRYCSSVTSKSPATVDNADTPSSVGSHDFTLQLVHGQNDMVPAAIELWRGCVVTLDWDPQKNRRGIAGQGMSQWHANICWDREAAAYCLTDRGSRDGVFLNGRRVGVAYLQVGDVIRLGQSLFVLVDTDTQSQFDSLIETASRASVAVLLVGETGTGKDHFAGEIHKRSGRTGALIPVSCASLTCELAASELFGTERGVTARATHPEIGLFRAAHQGTLLLDKIEDLPTNVQSLLLRPIQQGVIRPVGSTREVPVDVRIIATAGEQLRSSVSSGKLRLDFYARLCAHEIRVPPLRLRRAEILRILTDLAVKAGVGLRLGVDTAEALLLAAWPLNGHAIEHIVEYLKDPANSIPNADLIALGACEPEMASNWRPLRRQDSSTAFRTATFRSALRDRSALQSCLDRNSKSVSRVARELGTTRAQVYRWMKRLGIENASKA